MALTGLDNKLSEKSRRIARMTVRKTERGHYVAAVVTVGLGGVRRFEARNGAPMFALIDAVAKMEAAEISDA